MVYFYFTSESFHHINPNRWVHCCLLLFATMSTLHDFMSQLSLGPVPICTIIVVWNRTILYHFFQQLNDIGHQRHTTTLKGNHLWVLKSINQFYAYLITSSPFSNIIIAISRPFGMQLFLFISKSILFL